MAGCPIFPKNSHRSCGFPCKSEVFLLEGREVLWFCSFAVEQADVKAYLGMAPVAFWPPCFYGFLDPVLGAMMKQVCWHSRCSKAYRGLPEARMAGATVEETAFENVDMWQASVSQKQPIMGTEELGTMTLAALQEPQLSFFLIEHYSNPPDSTHCDDPSDN